MFVLAASAAEAHTHTRRDWQTHTKTHRRLGWQSSHTEGVSISGNLCCVFPGLNLCLQLTRQGMEAGCSPLNAHFLRFPQGTLILALWLEHSRAPGAVAGPYNVIGKPQVVWVNSRKWWETSLQCVITEKLKFLSLFFGILTILSALFNHNSLVSCRRCFAISV